MSVHQHNDGRWIVVYRDTDGKRHDKSFGRGEEAHSATLAFDNKMRPVVAGQPCVIQSLEHAHPITFGELVREFIRHSRSHGSTEEHLYSLACVARAIFFPFIGRDKPVTGIDYGRDILPLLNSMAEQPTRNGKPRSLTTVNKYGHFLAAFFNYAVERGYLPASPMRLWRKHQLRKKQIDLTLEDAQKIMAHAAPHLRWAMEVCFNLGTRSGESELLSLTWDDVDFEGKVVHVYGRKTKTDRFVPVSDAFLARLREMKAKARTGHIVEFRGRPISMIRNAFRQAVRKAGISYPVRMYDLRHLFATTLLDAGAPIGAVSRLMGHSRISTTVNVYYQPRQEEMKRAIDSLPPLGTPRSKTV